MKVILACLFFVIATEAGTILRIDQVEPSSQACTGVVDRTYFYNITSGECEQFPSGQCAANENGFRSYKRCNCTMNPDGADCKKFTPSFCLRDQHEGQGTATMTMYYYDNVTDSCSQFTYKGCGGNRNRFQSEDECLCKCSDPSLIQCSGLKRPKKYLCYYCPNYGYGKKHRKRCTKSAKQRYYYDADSDTCKQFTYKGCGALGNKNRFNTEDTCMCACSDAKSNCPAP